jgi:hypothetical protein
VRKSSVTTGNSDWDASRGTTAEDSEWIVLSSTDAIANDFDALTFGTHGAPDDG